MAERKKESDLINLQQWLTGSVEERGEEEEKRRRRRGGGAVISFPSDRHRSDPQTEAKYN